MSWITIDQLALELGVSKRTLQNRLSNGASMPPSYKPGRVRLFRREEVDAWIKNTREITSLNTQLSGVQQ